MKLFISFSILICSVLAVKGGDINSFIASTDVFMKKYVVDGSVSYSKIKSNKTEIENLYAKLAAISLTGMSDNAKKAFYVNAYNVIVIYDIVQNYPVKSPMDIPGFFDKRAHRVAGEPLTLNGLEKEKLLATYQDARFHFVLVCAAKSCPLLMSGAFTPDQIENQLTQRTKITINNNAWLKVIPSQKKVKVSKIFEWYKEDFVKKGKSLLSWINSYRNKKIPSDYSIEYYEYDWALND